MLAAVAAYAVYALGRLQHVNWGVSLRLLHFEVRVLLAATGLFGVAGLGLTRLLLPAPLRRHRALWVLPVGACVSGLALTVLGFAAVPFHLSLGLVLAGGTAMALLSWRRLGLGDGGSQAGAGRRSARGAVAWAAYLALLIAVVAVIPLHRADFLTVIGDGSDAHLAVGTAQFLQHHYPTSVHTDVPVNMVPLVWRSKQPIYYALGAVSSLAGLEPYETISTLAAIVLALAAVGFFLVARELLGAGTAAAAAATAAVGMDRMILHTAVHPYFNQTWGFMTMPFALVLAWMVTDSDGGRRTPGTVGLLVLFLALGAFAYPLALPIPTLALVVFIWRDRRRRRAAGEEVVSFDPRRLYRGRRSLAGLVALGLLLVIPLAGVSEKVVSGAGVLLPGHSLYAWGGDLSGYFPENEFLDQPTMTLLYIVAPLLILGIVLALRRIPRSLAWGLGAVLAFGVLGGIVFRLRATGYYFHFKLLVFVAPLAMTAALVGLARIRRVGAVIVALLLIQALGSANDELGTTFNQLPKSVLALRTLDHRLPRDASVRLDMNPGLQIWVAYLLDRQPLCSQRPLLGTSYPHVPISRRAQYILINHGQSRPFDAAGAPVEDIGQFRLYRQRPGVPGPDTCSHRRVQTVQAISAS